MLVALAWLKLQWNNPSRADHYSMKVCETVDGLFRKSDLNDYRVSFGKREQIPVEELPPGCPRPMTKDDIAKVERHWRREEAERLNRQIEDRKKSKK